MNKFLVRLIAPIYFTSVATASQPNESYGEITGEFLKSMYDSTATADNYTAETLKDLNFSFKHYKPSDQAILSYNNACDYIAILESLTNLNDDKAAVLEKYPNAHAAINSLSKTIDVIKLETLNTEQSLERDAFASALSNTLKTLQAFFK